MTSTALVYRQLGVTAASYDAVIDPEAVTSFAAATNDVRRTFRAGEPVPPVFGVVPTRPAVLAALRAAIPVELSAIVPVLHGEHRMAWQRPLRTGETVRVSGAPVGVTQKASGALVLLRIDVRTAQGEEVGYQLLTIFLPGWFGERDAGEPLASLDPLPSEGGLATVAAATTRDQSRRYGRASGDTTSFHMDETAAKRYGFEGVIMHGLCSLAIAVNAICGELARPSIDVRRLTARFTSPAHPGDALMTTYWSAIDGGIGFTSCAPDGRSVLDRGSIRFFDGRSAA